MTLTADTPFIIERHKDEFINYLEVVISPLGDIEYAVPSHAEKLLSIAGKRRDDCPPEYWFSVIDWLTSITGYICVYNDCYSGIANDAQKDTLRRLRRVGLYTGGI